jgi:hypothetical protein
MKNDCSFWGNNPRHSLVMAFDWESLQYFLVKDHGVTGPIKSRQETIVKTPAFTKPVTTAIGG